MKFPVIIIAFICGILFTGIISNKEVEQLPLEVVKQNDEIEKGIVDGVMKIRDSINLAQKIKDKTIDNNLGVLLPIVKKLESENVKLKKELAYWKTLANKNPKVVYVEVPTTTTIYNDYENGTPQNTAEITKKKRTFLQKLLFKNKNK